MTLVQDYLKTKTLKELYNEHGVKARIEKGYKASLNYDQLEARDADPLSQQCRGLIIRTLDGSDISEDTPLGETTRISLPFYRFFNLGQEAAAPVDLHHDETTIFNKLDGTLIHIYFDDIQDKWHVATRAVAEANIPINGWGDHTFRTLFEKALKDTTGADFNSWTKGLDSTSTYIFELCTPLNQVVVKHDEFSVVLIGTRETLTGKEFWPSEIAKHIDVPHVGEYHFGDTEEMLEFVRNRDPRKFEGVVVCDSQFRRVKIKNAQYLAYSRLKDAVSSPRNVMTLILGDNLDDAMHVMTDETKEKSLEMKVGVAKLMKDYRHQYEAVVEEVNAKCSEEQGSREHRKTFAITAKASGIWFEPAMKQYTGSVEGPREFIDSKMADNGSFPSSFLDYLIRLSENV